MKNDQESYKFEFELFGCVAVDNNGFALPIYRSFGFSSNASYVAAVQIPSDHESIILDFDVTDLSPLLYVEGGPKVISNSYSPSVYLYNNIPFAGSCKSIFEETKDFHNEMKEIAPLSFLDLSISARSGTCSEAFVSAVSYLSTSLGPEKAEEEIAEVLLRRLVHASLSRSILHENSIYELPKSINNFEVRLIDGKKILISLDDTIKLHLDDIKRTKFRDNINSFADMLGLSISLDERERDAQSEREDEREEFTEPDLIGKKSTRRTRRFGLAREIALDLGTTNTRIFSDTEGLILTAPSTIAIKTINGKNVISSVGHSAAIMEGRTPDDIRVVKPIVDGAIADLDLAAEMIKRFIKESKKSPSFFRPLDVVLCVPAGSTQMERNTISRAAKSAGASKVSVMLQPVAAAIGAGLPVTEPVASLIVNIGGGTTEVAIISLGSVAYSTSIRVGGDKMTEEIVTFFRRRFNLYIGYNTAERLKRNFGVASPRYADSDEMIRVRGRSVLNAVPMEIEVSQFDLAYAFEEIIEVVVDSIKIALENCAPELAQDIIEEGVMMTGGGALLSSLDSVIRDEVGLTVKVADDPENVVARGISIAMSDPIYRSLLL